MEMEMEMIYFSIPLLATIFLLYKILHHHLFFNPNNNNLPPSPPSLPIIGHIHLLKPPFHRTLHALSERLGPIFFLRLGSLPVLVVSSPSAAEECFTKNDIVFANRPHLLFAKHLGYNQTNLAWAPYGDSWRNLRRITTLTAFSQRQVELGSPNRKAEVRDLISELLRSSDDDQVLDLKEIFGRVTRNLVMRVVNGKPWPESLRMDTPGNILNVCDFLPVLRWVGFKGIEKEMVRLQKDRDVFLQSLVDEGRKNRAFHRTHGVQGSQKKKKTLVEELVDMQEDEPDYFTDDIVKGIIVVMLLAGSDTTARTLEWAMANLIIHPEMLEKARAEIDTHVGNGRLVDESDLPKLNYIRCIINETLRLFPAGPLLVPHYSSQDCTVGGYHVSKGTMLIVNAWALHRDPDLWEDATMFRPERFENTKQEGLKFIPFGIGRRACPGNHFALRSITLVLATLIQCFDWINVENEMVDFAERAVSGTIFLPKEKPLKARCLPRSSMKLVLSQIVKSDE